MTNNTDTLAPILTAISTANKEQLDAIFQAIQDRDRALQEIKKANALATLKVGQSVRISQDIKPRYLGGLTGKITRISGGHAAVALDQESAALLSRRSKKFADIETRRSRDLDGFPIFILEAI